MTIEGELYGIALRREGSYISLEMYVFARS